MAGNKDLVDIRQVALGGRNTRNAITFWDYALYPNDMPFPDVVIHEHSTNDMHVITISEAQKLNLPLEDYILQMNDKFVRTVLTKPPPFLDPNNNNDGKIQQCEGKPPLLLYFDDYLGNEQRKISQTLSFGQIINSLSTYYGFGFISYADAVRDLVYTKTTEFWFSSHSWPKRQVHPGMGMHITSTWILAFNFLNLATTYCDIMKPPIIAAKDKEKSESSGNYFHVLSLLRNKTSEVKYGPLKKRPALLPPQLDQNLTLDNISELWQDEKRKKENETTLLPQCDTAKKSLLISNRCLFSWVGDMIEDNLQTIQSVKEQMDPFLLEEKDWKLSNDEKKMGYIATNTTASFAMKFTNINHPVETVNFIVINDYKGSMIHVNASIIASTDLRIRSESSMDIMGFNEKHAKEIVVHELIFDTKANVGDTLRINVQLKSGNRFKILGMAFC